MMFVYKVGFVVLGVGLLYVCCAERDVVWDGFWYVVCVECDV